MVTRVCGLVVAALVWLGSVVGALAQAGDDVVWVQIEARPSLAQATERARAWAAELPDVNGFALRGGWYGIALGPYRRDDAQRVLQVYRAEGEIPRDAFIAFSPSFGAQFWPVGANLLNRGVVAAPQVAAPQEAETATAEPPEVEPADETPGEARRSEATLSRAEREALQVALRWAGYYTGAIDGAFGRGTRGSMAAWQGANGFEATGVLTTKQRAVLIGQYNAVLDGLDLRLVREARAGIEMQLPMGILTRGEAVSPFVKFPGDGSVAEAQVLLISQPGDQTTLYGLYDILQTLEIVPLDGPRTRRSAGFSITGQNDRIVTEIRASLDDGEIKGFAFVWPAGDEERRTRLLAEMETSFARISGVLDPATGVEASQDVDLLAGLQVRQPRLSRSGFFVDAGGTVVTTSEAVAECTRITLDDDVQAALELVDPVKGIAVLRPETALAPLSVARFSPAPPRLKSEVAVAGYSFGGVLGAPSVTFGTLVDIKGLGGEAGLTRLAMTTLPGDAGGPVLDAGGGVLGMLLPRPDNGRNLPPEVQFAADSSAIRSVLEQAGAAAALAENGAALDPVDLTAAATGMTVLVSCWD